MSRRMFMGLALTLVLVAAGVWYGGVWATRNELWDAPWVVPHGIALEGEPQLGVAYQVSVNAHCGLRNVKFDGSEWGISGELGDSNPPPGINDLDTGTVTLTTADTAIWTTHQGERRTLRRGTGLPDVEGCL